MGEVATFTITCRHCDGGVEFPEESHGATVACPHCGFEIFLFAHIPTSKAPATFTSPHPAKTAQPDKVQILARCVMAASLLTAAFAFYRMMAFLENGSLDNGSVSGWIVLLAASAILFLVSICFAGGVKYEGYDGSKSTGNTPTKTGWQQELAGALGGLSAAAFGAVRFYQSGGDWGHLMGIVLFIALVVIGLAVYFFPSYVAYKRTHKNLLAILALNLLTGWSFVGWVISLVWALKVE